MANLNLMATERAPAENVVATDDEELPPPPRPTRRRAAVWKRIVSQDADKKRSCRVVDAYLEDDPTDHKQSVKRRRLTLLDTDSTTEGIFASLPNKKKTGYRILDPVSRLVDDNLQKVHSGDISAEQHVHFITTDPSLMGDSKRWLTWCHSMSGNLLHACASWNNIEVTSELLTRDLDGLADAVDDQGRTAYEVAELCGHSQICDVLEAFGADTSNYVFDIYCLEDAAGDEDEPETQGIDETALELQGGVGYWNEDGQLVLEKSPDALDEDSVADDNDEVDSNDERWDGNDYPDEDADGWGESDDEEEPDDTFRNRAAAYYNDDGGDGDFDASYGISALPEAEYDEYI